MGIESNIIMPNKNIEKVEWGIHSKENTIEIVESLNGALKNNDPENVREILKNSKNLKSLTEGGEYDLLKDGFESLIEEQYGKEKNLSNITGDEMLMIINEFDIPEQVLIEILSGYYHKKDGASFCRMMSIIFEKREQLKNKMIIPTANQNLASWRKTIENKAEKAVTLNKEILLDSTAIGDEILATKALFGITYNKDLRPTDKIADYKKLAKKLDELENKNDIKYLVMRFKLEEARERMKLADRQKGGGDARINRKENLQEVKKLCEEILDTMKDSFEYPKLKNGALELIRTAKVLVKREERKEK